MQQCTAGRPTGTGLVYSPPHTPLPPARLPRSCALLAAQASLTSLPEDLIVSILRRAWADRPPRPAAEEVRAAAGLSCVCGRMRALLREAPLALALDFSAECLSDAQRSWLLDPMQAGRVEAASFHTKDALWKQPLLGQYLALHGRTLLRLLGMPLRLLATFREEKGPALDLSGLHLTKLGIDCCDISKLARISGPDWVLLWPECLPGVLEELNLLNLFGVWLEELAWAQHVGTGAAGRLPRLQTLRVTSTEDTSPLETYTIPLFSGFPRLPDFEIDAMHDYAIFDIKLFERVRNLRITAAGGCDLFLYGLRTAKVTCMWTTSAMLDCRLQSCAVRTMLCSRS